MISFSCIKAFKRKTNTLQKKLILKSIDQKEKSKEYQEAVKIFNIEHGIFFYIYPKSFTAL